MCVLLRIFLAYKHARCVLYSLYAPETAIRTVIQLNTTATTARVGSRGSGYPRVIGANELVTVRRVARSPEKFMQWRWSQS